jgi:Tol biopolymer transport system component
MGVTDGGRRHSFLALALASLLIAVPSSAASTPTNNLRVSIGSAGEQGNGRSFLHAISPEGRFALFLSDSTNLVPGDTNAAADLFVRDRVAGATILASTTSSGGPIDRGVGNTTSGLSADGTRVAFESQSTSLAPNDSDADIDVFVHDLGSGRTTLASVAPDGSPGAKITESGRTFSADSNWPDLSADGRFVAFLSDATNLLSADPAHQLFAGLQVYLRDLMTGQTVLASVSQSGEPASCRCIPTVQGPPSLSADGRFVAFQSNAVNLVPGDTNGTTDLFVWDRLTGTTERVSVSSNGAQADREEITQQPAISPDGRFVAFGSNATTLVEGDTNGLGDVFVRDRATSRTERVSLTNRGRETRPHAGYGSSLAPALSADGRIVSFTSSANDLVANDSWPLCCDVFVRDRANGTTERMTIPTGGGTPVRGSGTSGSQALSVDGRFVAITSEVSLGPGDTNGLGDAYVHDRTIAAGPTPVKGGAPATLRVIRRGRRIIASGGVPLCCGSYASGTVAVGLYRYRRGKFVRLKRRMAPLGETDTYSTSFARPKAGRCKATAHYLGNEFYAGGTAFKIFRC